MNVELQSQLDSDSIACSVVTDTSCTAIITRDVSTITGDAFTDTTVTRDIYTVTVTQTNVYGSTVNMFKFNGRTVLTCTLVVGFCIIIMLTTFTVDFFSFLTASILFITDVMVDADDDPLSVTVRVNELCPSYRDYSVLATFGTRSGTGDCQGQVDVNVTISSGDNATLSVPAHTVDRESNEVYCFVARVNDIPTPAGCDGGDESEGLSTGAAVGITMALTLLVPASGCGHWSVCVMVCLEVTLWPTL